MTDLAELPPPGENAKEGYYPDPLGSGRARWWDGTRWTLTVGPLMGADAPRDKALEPPTKLCPHCAVQSKTFAANCPNCGRSYTQISPLKIAAIVVAAALVVVGGCAGCLVIGAGLVDDELEEHSITRAEFASVALGTPRDEIESRFGDPIDTSRSGGATCTNYYETDQGLLEFDYFEFCFRGGALDSKRAY